MTSKATTIEEYIDQLPEERKDPIAKLRSVINKNLDKTFKEQMSYGMLGYIVPHNVYPAGYHCSPELPLPFMNLASQKNFISLYCMSLYAASPILAWFELEWSKHTTAKLDMGKSCVRFKKMDTIPYKLIGELCTKMNAKDWITTYESLYKYKK
jgi:hypothetical protein